MLTLKRTLPVFTLLFMLSIILGTGGLDAQPLNNHLQFDGVDDYVSLNNMDVSGNAITLEALINSSNLNNCSTGDCRIISKAIGVAEDDHYWMLSTFNNGAESVLRFRLTTNGITTTQIATIGSFSNNTWYHVAATYDGSTMKLFLDGNEISSIPKTGSLTTNATADAWIGGNPPIATTRPWQGGIDEVRIWNTARTAAEIQANLNTELTGSESGLKAYYQFTEGTGQTINDSAGNNNTVLGSTNSTDTNDPTFVISNPQQEVTVNLNVFLEGAYDPAQAAMTGELLLRGVVPQGQPYLDAPWNYPGTEGSGWLPIDYPVETVDWVLVSLRETLDPETEVARVAAVLLKDGTISPFNIDLNGATNPLYVMIEHRNHLPILSAQSIPIVNNTLSYDFTAENSYSPSGFGQKQVGANWMMYGGNADQDALNGCDINAADRIYWQTVNGLFDVYNPGDYDLNGDINAADRIIFSVNNGIFTSIPKSDSSPELSCTAPNFVLDTCSYMVSWTHPNPLSTTVNYDLKINGIDPGPSVVYPATSKTVDICNLLGINSGNGSVDIELFYWYDGDVSDIRSAGICTINYNFQSSPPGNGTTYADILANAPAWMCVQSANEYLAEFLRQNPDVSYWNQDHAGQLITPLAEPAITGTVVNISPSGNNHTQLIENAIAQAGQDGAVDGGGGIFLVNNLLVNEASLTLRNITLKPSVNAAYKCVTVAAPDVTFFQVSLDLENKPYQYGIDVNANADRFAMVESTITNLYNNSGGSGAMLRLSQSTDDVYIVNNEFIHGIGESPPNDNSLLRGIVVNSSTRDDPKGGIIASNLFDDLQAEGKGDDADAMFFGNFASRQYQIGFRMAVLANEGVNAGKRLIKAQGGGVDAHSNVNHWKDLNGELGIRTTRCHYDNHGVSNTKWTNNLGISDYSNPNSEAFFMQIGNHLWSDNYFAEGIVFNCNKNIQNVVNTPTNVSSYGFVITDYSNGANSTPWPANSEIKNNVLEGTGKFRYIWWFRFGNDPLGTQFNYSGNQVSVNYDDLHRP